MRVFLDDVFFFASLLLKKRPQMITLLLNSQQIYKILHTVCILFAYSTGEISQLTTSTVPLYL